MEFVAEDSVPKLEIPIYYLAGKQDLTCCYTMQKEYYDQLKAPLKGFYTFAHSAHSPLFEEPARAVEILVNDVIQGSVSMSDAK